MKSIKGNRGGKRPGAGRKPKEITELKKLSAEQALASIDETKAWQECLKAADLRVRLDALKYLTDRRDGKAAQSMNMNLSSGGEAIALNVIFVSPSA